MSSDPEEHDGWEFEHRVSARMVGKSAVEKIIADGHLMSGGHVHRYSHNDGEMCLGGDSTCPLFGVQLAEAMEAWE